MTTVTADLLSLWVIYDHPRDHPDNFVVRRQQVGPDGAIASTVFVLADSLEEARRFVPAGRVNIGRYEQDDPVIAEVWL